MRLWTSKHVRQRCVRYKDWQFFFVRHKRGIRSILVVALFRDAKVFTKHDRILELKVRAFWRDTSKLFLSVLLNLHWNCHLFPHRISVHHFRVWDYKLLVSFELWTSVVFYWKRRLKIHGRTKKRKVSSGI